MTVVALTGGIGSGKSTVSAMLARRGATIVDADAVARSLQRAPSAVLDAIAARFGADVIRVDGELDRAKLAGVVFNDAGALADLNLITHPPIRAEIGRRLAEHDAPDRIVVLDTPLLTVVPDGGFAGVIVVDAPVEVALARLTAGRGMDEADARARIANQASRDERRAEADFVVDNAGTPDDLEREVDRLWTWLQTLRPMPST